MSTHFAILVEACLVNNFVLAYFLGICPFLGVSNRLPTAARMGAAVTFVMVVSAVATRGVDLLLEALGVPFLRLIGFIVVIASAVQLVEMFVRKVSPTLFAALGIFLPLITTNCAILGLALFSSSRGYTLPQAVTFAIGAGAGFTLALVLLAGLRERLRLSAVPDLVEGAAATLLLAGMLSLAFMGFAGLGSGT